MHTEDPTIGKEWLTPTEALALFAPLQTSLAGQAPLQSEEARFGIRIGDIGLLLAPRLYSEVLEQAMVHPLPATPAWFQGILNLRGNLVPVFDLRILFGGQLDDAAALARLALRPQKQKLLILDKGERSVGIVIKGLPRPIGIQHKLGQLPPLPTSLNGHISNSYEHEGEVWLEFEHLGFFEAIGTQLTG